MAQHYLLSPAASSLSMREIFRMTEEQAYEVFKSIKWPDGIPTCPQCGCKDSWTLIENRKWKCKGKIESDGSNMASRCYLQYTVTSRTPLNSRKRSFCDILASIATFASGVLGAAALSV